MIIKLWPFRRWTMDLIGKINMPSSKHHTFIIVDKNYFNKWVESIPMKSASQIDIIKFIKEYILYRFGLPEAITTDQGSVFTGDLFKQFAKDYKFKIIHSTPYYA